jgi:methionyl-tRNA formyltransferase
MKALLVTSQVTFVPRNYDDFVVGMATCPQIGGLLVLENADARLILRGLGLVAGGAPRVGGTLLANRFGPSRRRRELAFARQGKPAFSAASINSRQVAELVREQGFDLLVNARTRSIYRKGILRAPRFGCINVHHGLLPDQRGAMCDLWSLAERRPAGFSVHVMTPEVDAGKILASVPVSNGSDLDYLDYLARSARAEVPALCDVLARIEARDGVEGRPNAASAALVVRRTPSRRDIDRLRKSGVRV